MNSYIENLNEIMKPYFEKIDEINNIELSREKEKTDIYDSFENQISEINNNINILKKRILRINENKESEINNYIENLVSINPNVSEDYINTTKKSLEEEYKKQEDSFVNEINELKRKRENLEKVRLEKISEIDLRPNYIRVYQYELGFVKDDLRKQLYQEKRKIELELEEENLNHERLMMELSSLPKESETDDLDGLYSKRKELFEKSHNSIEKMNELRSALDKINEYWKLVSPENDKYINLSPWEKDEYERRLKEKEEEFLDYETDYQSRLDEYNKLLEMYEEDFDRLTEMYEKLEKEEITFEEYDKFSSYMLNRYQYLDNEYKKINELYEETKDLVSKNKKWHPSLTKQQIEELKSKGINKPEGLLYEEYLKEQGLNNESIIGPVLPSNMYGIGKIKIEKEEPKEDIEEIKIEHKPKLTWKTALSVAAGIGIGATVFFTAGPVGVAVMNAVAGLTKVYVSKKRQQAKAKRLSGEISIDEFQVPKGKLKAAIFRLKQYLKSEEGLRDMSWLLTSAIITGTSLTIIDSISNVIEASKSTPQTELNTAPQPEPNPSPQPDALIESTTNVNPTTEYGIGVGESIDGYNITTGYDTANYAINNVHAENLLTKYGDGATIKEFVTSTGEHFKSGTLQEIMNKTGLSADKISARLITSKGGEYAWVSGEQLKQVVSTVAGKVL